MDSQVNGGAPLPLCLRVVPDTSVIVEGFLSRKIESEELAPSEVIIHEAVIAELESQANKGRETGYLGLEEIKRIRALAESGSAGNGQFKVSFKGSRPKDFEIKYAKSGEIDSLIRQLAADEKATLITADKVQCLVAESKGLAVILFEFDEEEAPFILDKYFDASTMSAHLKENCPVRVKRGVPGNWEFITFQGSLQDVGVGVGAGGDVGLDRESMKALAKEIIEEANAREDGFVESDKKGSTIVQLGINRVVIARPPFSDGYEITAVRPVKRLALNDYCLGKPAFQRIAKSAEGILIAGAPGEGKTTFAQALAEHYLSQGKIVKTIESPRDLNLPREVTQYSLSHASSAEVRDVILLTRPDHTVFDEMRDTDDFRLFSDLRLSGVGMVGVIHATRPIDAIQRFLGRIDLGVIPHIVDTVFFIRAGVVEKVLLLEMRVKVPGGMQEADLARPVITVSDFETGRLEFEIYSYGEETVVVPARVEQRTPVQRLAEKAIVSEVDELGVVSHGEAEVLSDYKCRIAVPLGEKAGFVGEGGSRIVALEEKLGLKVDVVEVHEKKFTKRGERTETIRFAARADKKNVLIDIGERHADEDIDIYVDGEFLFSARASKRGVVNVSLGNAIGKMLNGCLTSGRNVEIRGKLSD